MTPEPRDLPAPPAPGTEAEEEIRPYPGLRPFREDESYLYFGREQHRGELLKRLGPTRFIAVVGTSGSGKSSLVRAGLLPDLYCGYLPGAGSDWVVVDISPGNDPIGRLAAAFAAAGWPVEPGMLRTNSTQILELADRHLLPGQQLLVLVDQFEELFRLKTSDDDAADRDEKASFVRLLLNAGGQRAEASGQANPCVHVVIAMRSEFLGRASAYRGLPEAIDQGQYLIPRLSREQLRQAIECPVRVAEGRDQLVDEALVQRLLNELGDDQDQLPVLQHALMRTWQVWTRRGRTGRMDERAYTDCGGFTQALSIDANEALDETTDAMGDRGGAIVQQTFQSLRETDVSGGQTRRPTKVEELCEIAGCSDQELIAALEPFRRRSFVFFSKGTSVADTTIDISHEALLRRWDTLKKWIDRDDLDRRLYLRIATRAADEEHATQPDYFAPPLLGVLVKFWAERKPPRAWARRHHEKYDLAREFLAASQRHQQVLDDTAARQNRELAEAVAKRARTRERAYFGAAVALALLLGGSLALKNALDQRSALAAQGKVLEAQLMAAKAAGIHDANIESRLQVAAEAVRRVPLLDTQQLLLAAIFAAAKPLKEIAASTGDRDFSNVALSPSGDVLYLVVGGELRGVEVDSGATRFSTTLQEPGANFRGIVLPTGQDLVVVSELVSVVDAATGRVTPAPAVTGPIVAAAVSADGTKAAFLGSESVHICDLSDQCAAPVTHPIQGFAADEPVDLALSPKGDSLAIIGDSAGRRALGLYGTTPWQPQAFEAVDDSGEIIGLALDVDRVRVCSTTNAASYDSSLGLREQNRFSSEAHACRLSADRAVTAHDDGTVRVWDTRGNPVALAGARVASATAFSLAGDVLVTADDRVRVWDVRTFGHQASAPGGFSFAGRFLFGEGRAFDLDAGKPAPALQIPDEIAGPPRMRLRAISGSLRYAVYLQQDFIVSRRELGKSRGDTGDVELALAEVGRGTSPKVRWRYSIKEASSRSSRRGAALPTVSISPNERYVLLGDGPRTVILDASNGGVVATLDWAAALAFSPDGKMLAGAEAEGAEVPGGARTSEVRLLEWPGLKPIGQLRHPTRVTALAFRSDSRALLALTATSTIHAWDLDLRREFARLSTPSRVPSDVAVAFTPSGRFAISDASGLTILPGDPARWIDEACTRIVRNLKEDEWSTLLGPNVAYSKTCANKP